MYRKALFTLLMACVAFTASSQRAEKFFEEGNKYLAEKKYSSAVSSYSKAIKEKDNNPVFYLKRGIAYSNMKEIQKAYEDLTTAIKYDYTLGEAYLHRASIFMTSRMPQDAVNDLDMVIKYAPNDSIRFLGHLRRSSGRAEIRNYKGAFEDSKIYYDHDTTSRDALSNMAMAKNNLKASEEALGYLYKVLVMYPKDTIALMNLGFINISLERWDSAYKYLELALKANPREAYAYSNLSYVKMKKGDLDGALRDVNQSLALNSGNSWAYRNRALIYFELGENEKGCADLYTSIRKGFTDRYGDEVDNLLHKHCEKD
jgi:tetratricopeptide (TPR) repeat protein